MGSKRGQRQQVAREAFRVILFDMEPELRLLEGLIANLRVLSEAGDSIEPVALAILCEYGGVSVERLQLAFRGAIEELAKNSTKIG